MGEGVPPPKMEQVPYLVCKVKCEGVCVRVPHTHVSHMMQIKPPLTLQALLGDIIDILHELCFY